jgi:predicted heme/steroid binding protein
MAVAMSVGVLSFALLVSSVWGGQEGREQEKKMKVELPAAVAKAVQVNVPNAEIETLTVEKEAGITLYDIEFKAGKGEIEVAEDGTVMDIATIITMNDIPQAAAEAIRKAALGATIKQVEKSEVRAEIKKEDKKGTIVKLAAPQYVYEAELAKNGQTGEIQVAADGTVIEGPKWGTGEAREQEEMGEKEEAEEQEEEEEAEEAAEVKAKPSVNLKILPAAAPAADRPGLVHGARVRKITEDNLKIFPLGSTVARIFLVADLVLPFKETKRSGMPELKLEWAAMAEMLVYCTPLNARQFLLTILKENYIFLLNHKQRGRHP